MNRSIFNNVAALARVRMKLNRVYVLAKAATGLFAIFILICTQNDAFGEDATDQDRLAEAKLQRERLLKEMHSLADTMRIYRQSDGSLVKRIEEPVFRFNSPVRLYQDGSIWAWGMKGRPLVFLEMFTVNAKRLNWVHGCVLTSDVLVEARRTDEKVWYPKQPGIEFKPFPEAPAPSKEKNVRLLQMKQLSRRFDAHQFWTSKNTRFDLRLLVKPVHRYDDAENGLVDGAVFLMAHEIEPEVIIMIEAVETSAGLAWQYGVTPIGSAEFHISLDDKKVYQRGRTPKKTGYPTDPYHSFHRNATRE